MINLFPIIIVVQFKKTDTKHILKMITTKVDSTTSLLSLYAAFTCVDLVIKGIQYIFTFLHYIFYFYPSHAYYG